MKPDDTSSVSPQDQKNQLRIPWDQKYWLGIPWDQKIWISIPQDQKYIGSVSNETIINWVSTPFDYSEKILQFPWTVPVPVPVPGPGPSAKNRQPWTSARDMTFFRLCKSSKLSNITRHVGFIF